MSVWRHELASVAIERIREPSSRKRYKMARILILLLFYLSYCNGNVQFPADAEILSRQTQSDQISQYQLKSAYEQFIDDIITKGVGDLGFTVHRSPKNFKKDSQNYIVYSPVSIACALYMLLLGSNGQTFNELTSLLGVSQGVNIANNSIKIHEEFGDILRNLESNGNDNSIVKFANGLFVQNDFQLRQQYVDISKYIYQSEIMNLDFRGNPTYAKDTINNWTNQKTYGKIDKVLNENPVPETRVIIVSSLYFKADWEVPFPGDATSLHTFYPNGKSEPSNIKFYQMAHISKYLYHNDQFLNCEILGLPYKNNKYTFYIVIPHNSNKNKLKQLENRLTYTEMKRLASSVVRKRLLAAIPRMKLSTDLRLNDILEDNGLKTLFDPQTSNLGLLSSYGDANVQSYLPSVGIDDDQPFVFSRMSELPSNATAKRRKRNINRNKRQSRVISSVRMDNNIDNLRHLLSKDVYNNPGLYVNQVLHKVVIDVNEQGTEAAAVTVAATEKSNVQLVKANVPFLFFIQHEESKMILFWGSVITPSPSFVT